MPSRKYCRVLAIETRSQKVGYAVLESSKTLVDWGVRRFARGAGPDFARKLTMLLETARPTLILISGIGLNHPNGHLVQAPVAEIKRQALLRSIPAKSLNKYFLRMRFKRYGHWNKQEVAQAIARRFPELAWHLPRKRRAWDSESASQVMFDAVAIAIHYFAAKRSSGITNY